MAKARTASARESGDSPGPLGFLLALDEGRAVLELPEGAARVGMARVKSLRLEVPEVRYPFDLSAGLTRFQSRRCLLRELTVAVDGPELGAWLAQAPLGRYGLSDPWVAPGPGGLRLVLRAELGDRTATVSGRLALTARPGGRLRLQILAPRAYGFLPVPAPLVVAGLFTALGAGPVAEASSPLPPPTTSLPWWARPPALLRMDGPASLELAALDLLLYPLLAGRGWRLPERRSVALVEIDVAAAAAGGGVGVAFRWQPGPAPEDQDGDRPDAGAPGGDLFSLGEEALAAGELRAAREAYRHEAVTAPGGAAEDRLLALLLASPDTLSAASEEAQARLARRPDDPEALLARGVVAQERGRLEEAAGFMERAAECWEGQGEALEAACARHGASEALTRAGRYEPGHVQLSRALTAWTDERAPLRRRWAEQLAAGGPAMLTAAVPEGLVRARDRWREGDLAASVRDYEALLAAGPAGLAAGAPAGAGPPGPSPAQSAWAAGLAAEAESESHLRLAQWARLNGQLMVASRHLSAALKRESTRGAPLEVLVEVLEAFGRTEELEAALVRRRKRASAEAEGWATARALGGVLERSGRGPQAATLYRELLAARPDDIPLLRRLAELFRRESQHSELVGVLERLFNLGTQGVTDPEGELDVEAVGLELAQLLEDMLGARERAAAVLERLCAACPDSREAREALAALDRRPAGAED